MGETWGISGPTFLLFYVVLAVAVLIASIRARRAVTRAGAGEPVTAIRTRPHDVAYLSGGAELALVSALTALRLQLQLAQRAKSEAEREQALATLGEGIARATHVVEQLLVTNKRQRDTEAKQMDAQLYQWQYGPAYGQDLFRQTAQGLDTWRQP